MRNSLNSFVVAIPREITCHFHADVVIRIYKLFGVFIIWVASHLCEGNE